MNHNNPTVFHWRTLTRHHPAGFLLAAQLLSLVLYAVMVSPLIGLTIGQSKTRWQP